MASLAIRFVIRTAAAPATALAPTTEKHALATETGPVQTALRVRTTSMERPATSSVTRSRSAAGAVLAMAMVSALASPAVLIQRVAAHALIASTETIVVCSASPKLAAAATDGAALMVRVSAPRGTLGWTAQSVQLAGILQLVVRRCVVCIVTSWPRAKVKERAVGMVLAFGFLRT